MPHESRQVRRARERAEHKGRNTPPPLPDGLGEKVGTVFEAFVEDGVISPPAGMLEKIDEFVAEGYLDLDDKTVLQLLLLDGVELPDGVSLRPSADFSKTRSFAPAWTGYDE